MSDVITKPGKYVENGTSRLSRVIHIQDGWAFGFDYAGDPAAWACESGLCYGDSFDITGPFHEPPTPPEGFELMDRETYRAQEGDIVFWGGAWGNWSINNCSSAVGMTADQMDAAWPAGAPRTIASPIPKQETPEPQWTCTGELRWNESGEACQARDVELDYARKAIKTVMVLEQLWTNGTDSEWRPVPVVNG